MSPSRPPANGPQKLPDAVITAWAQRVAETFPVAKPAAALKRAGVVLCVSANAPSSHKGLGGTWDSGRRRIDLYGVTAAANDTSLVEVFGQQLWHALAQQRAQVLASKKAAPPADAEGAAARFAKAWVRTLGAARVKECAAALRALG